MLYSFSVTIPANTTDASPYKQKLALTAGRITYIDVTFPAGCNGLVKVRILKQGSTIVPLSSGQYLVGNDQTVRSTMSVEMSTGGYELEFQGSSPSSSYAHTLTVGVNMENIPAPTQASAYNNIEEYLYRICVALNVHDGLKPIAGFPSFAVAPIFPYPTKIPPSEMILDPTKTLAGTWLGGGSSDGTTPATGNGATSPYDGQSIHEFFGGSIRPKDGAESRDMFLYLLNHLSELTRAELSSLYSWGVNIHMSSYAFNDATERYYFWMISTEVAKRDGKPLPPEPK